MIPQSLLIIGAVVCVLVGQTGIAVFLLFLFAFTLL